MKRILVLVLFVLLLGSCRACTNARLVSQAQAANAISDTANSVLPLLLDHYRLQGDLIVAQGKSEQEVREKLEKLKAKWEPLWSSWELLKKSKDAWDTALEGKGKDGDPDLKLAALKKQYCSFMELWPEGLPAVPLAAISCGAANGG